MTVPGCSPEEMDADIHRHPTRWPPPSDPWLRRRQRSFGASEATALLIATGRRAPVGAPKWIQELARPIRVSVCGSWRQVPRLIARKVGLSAPGTSNAVMDAGRIREHELYRQLEHMLGRGTAPDACSWLLGATLSPASSMPREFLPLIDRESRLSATPDAWARDLLADLVTVEIKCSVDTVDELHQHHRDQVQVQIATMDAASGVLVLGQRWAAQWLDRGGEPSGPIVAWTVERDDVSIAELREAANEAWEDVEKLRMEMNNGE